MSVARFVIGIYIIAKVVSLDWSVPAEWPVFLHTEYTWLIFSQVHLDYFWIEGLLLLGSLTLFTFGYRTGLTAFLSAVLVAHFSGIYFMIHNSGTIQTFLFDIYLLIIYGLYTYHDEISIDELRRTGGRNLSDLNSLLKSTSSTKKNLPFLKLVLITVGLTYFFNGLIKIVNGPVWEWVTPASLNRYMTAQQILTRKQLPVAEFFIQHPEIAFIAAVGTIILEAGFIVSIVKDWAYDLFIVGLIGMHTVIAFALTPFFWNHYIVFALFLPWDSFYTRLLPDEEMDVFYDEHCYFCARSLVLLKHLDLKNCLNFHSQSDAQEGYVEQERIDYEKGMFAFDDETSYTGYYAFMAIFNHLRITAPISWLMKLPGIRAGGERVYAHIAANRHRYFVCEENEASN